MAPLLRPIVFEYLVTGSLDGVTPSPQVVLPPDPDAPLRGNFIRQTVSDLGLVDLTGVGSDNYADRIIKWLEILGPNTPTGGNNVALAFADGRQHTEIVIPSAANGIYSRNCLFIPQTARLQLNNMIAGPDPIVVRLGIWQPQRISDLAAYYEACCCQAKCVNSFEDPCFTRALYTSTAGQRSISLVAPDTGARGAAVVVSVTGTGFAATDKWVLRQISSNPDVPQAPTTDKYIYADEVTFLSSVSVDLHFQLADSDSLGLYDLVAAPELGGETFSFALEDAFTVT